MLILVSVNYWASRRSFFIHTLCVHCCVCVAHTHNDCHEIAGRSWHLALWTDTKRFDFAVLFSVRWEMFYWIELESFSAWNKRSLVLWISETDPLRTARGTGRSELLWLSPVGAAECGAEALSETPYDSHSEPVSFPAPHSSSNIGSSCVWVDFNLPSARSRDPFDCHTALVRVVCIKCLTCFPFLGQLLTVCGHLM